MQKMISVVINVYKFGKKCLQLAFFGNFCTNFIKQFQSKLHKMHFLQHGKNYMQLAQIKLHTDEKFPQYAKI